MAAAWSSPFRSSASRLRPTIGWPRSRRPSAASGVAEERDQALAALKELELDHRTGKVTDEDYRAMVGPLRRRAAEALRALDAYAPRSADRGGPMSETPPNTPETPQPAVVPEPTPVPHQPIEPAVVPEPLPPPDEGDRPAQPDIPEPTPR